MGKLLAVISIVAGLSFCDLNASAQCNSVVNVTLLTGYQFPTSDLSKYYKGGIGGEFKIVASISNRQSFLRILAIANTSYYRFGGRTYWDYDNSGGYNAYRTYGFGLTSAHGGLRLDLGYNNEMPFGMYISQDLGLTYISGPTGGVRLGRTFGVGFLFGNVDMSMGLSSWMRSVGGQFRYFTLNCGYVF